MILKVAVLAGLITASVATSALAQQVQTFGYDVHGRLTTATRTTGASNQTTVYSLDNANNRTSRAVSTTTSMVLSKAMDHSSETRDSSDPHLSVFENQQKGEVTQSVSVDAVAVEREDKL